MGRLQHSTTRRFSWSTAYNIRLMSSAKAAKVTLKFVYFLYVDDIEPKTIFKNAFVVYQGHRGDLGAQLADVLYLPCATYTENSTTWGPNTEDGTQFLWGHLRTSHSVCGTSYSPVLCLIYILPLLPVVLVVHTGADTCTLRVFVHIEHWDAQAPIREHPMVTCASGSLNGMPLLGKYILSLLNFPLMGASRFSNQMLSSPSLPHSLSPFLFFWIIVSTIGVGSSYWQEPIQHSARLRTHRTLWDAQAPIREHQLLTCASGSLNCMPLLGKHLFCWISRSSLLGCLALWSPLFFSG